MAREKAVVQAIKRGDRMAFEAFASHHHKPLLGYLERLLNDREKAEDLVQEAFLKLLRQLRDRPAPDHPSAWLYRVASNLCRDYWRSAGYRKEKQMPDPWRELKDRQAQAVDICEHRETRREMMVLLNELPEAQRRIVILRFYNEFKLQEIAEMLDCPIGTVKSRLFYAMRFLKSRLEERGKVDRGEPDCVGSR